MSSTKDFIVESEFSNLANIRLIVESYVWGRSKIHNQKSSQTLAVIITDFNTECVRILADTNWINNVLLKDIKRQRNPKNSIK